MSLDSDMETYDVSLPKVTFVLYGDESIYIESVRWYELTKSNLRYYMVMSLPTSKL